MPSIYDQIYALAEPYWQTRAGELHMPASYALAQALLRHYPAADAAVVLPAILLHDIGYFGIPEDTQLRGLAGAPQGWDAAITRLHEQRGAQLAGELLARLGYDPAKTALIVQIIDGHDSRPAAHSLEDALVKDADKLWRFTLSGVQVCKEWTSKTPAAFIDFVAGRIGDWMLTEHGAQMARELLAASRQHFLGGE